MSVINPQRIVDERIIENLTDDFYEVQQNGIDLTLESISLITGGVLKKDSRKIDEYIEVECEKGIYKLMPGAYSIEFNQKIKVPENMCAQIVQRSTLNRMGAFILSGVYDSGFSNKIGAVLRVDVPIEVEKGVRIAQIMFFEAESASLYQGIYNQSNDLPQQD